MEGLRGHFSLRCSERLGCQLGGSSPRNCNKGSQLPADTPDCSHLIIVVELDETHPLSGKYVGIIEGVILPPLERDTSDIDEQNSRNRIA